MIDTSDGLSTDLAHICEESGVGAEVEAELIPRASVGKPAHQVDLALALHGGEDYELLFTAPSNRKVPAQIAGVPITEIGHITRAKENLPDKKRRRRRTRSRAAGNTSADDLILIWRRSDCRRSDPVTLV